MTQNVLIIGAGPVGLTLAIELARFAVPVRIVEKMAKRTDKSKALVLWSRTLELLDRQPGGSAPFIEAGCKANAVNFFAGGERIGRVGMETVNGPYPYALMIPQSDTERLLEERLNELGVSVERGVEVTGLSIRSDGVDAVLRNADGREEKTSAIGSQDATAPTVWCGIRLVRSLRATRWTATGCWRTCTCAAIPFPTARRRFIRTRTVSL